MSIRIFGWFGGSIAVIYNIPQIYKNYKTKSCDDISQVSISMRILSYIFYIIHGIIIDDPPLLWMTLIGCLQLILLWIQIIFYTKRSIKIINRSNKLTVVNSTEITEEIETTDVITAIPEEINDNII